MGFIEWAFPVAMLVIVGLYIWSQVSVWGGSSRFHEKLLKQSKEMNEKLLNQSKEMDEALLQKQSEEMLKLADMQTQIDDLKRELEEMKRKE